MKSLQVVFVISSFRPRVGGGEVQAERLAQALVSRGHRVTVLTRRFRHDLPPEERLHGVTIIRVQGQSRFGYLLNMANWIRRNRSAIDLLHSLQSLSPLVASSMTGRLYGIPVLCTPMTRNPELSWLESGVGLVRRVLYRTTARWIAKSHEIEIALEGYAPGRVARISNGVDTDFFSPSGRAASEVPVVVFVGRLEKPKRLDRLLLAWARIGVPAQLLVVGEGSLRGDWEAMVRNLGLDNVKFLGHSESVQTILEGADLFVLPSDLEGMPNALLEAMSMGIACVASGVGAVPELLRDGTGVLMPEDTAALAHLLSGLLQNPERRKELGQRARRLVVNEYSLDAVTSRIERQYREVLGMEK